MTITAKPREFTDHAVIERILVSDTVEMYFGELAIYAWAHDPQTGERFVVGAPCTEEVASESDDVKKQFVQIMADFHMDEHRRELMK